MRGIQGAGGTRRRWLALLPAFAFAASLTALPAARAEGASALLQVSARVLKHASVRALVHPPSFTISDTDLARGFVELPAHTRLAVRSNSPQGYLLVFEQQSDLVRQVVVRGLEREVEVGAGGGVVPQEAIGPGMAQRTHALGFRFLLSGTATRGVHPWPLQLSVVPL